MPSDLPGLASPGRLGPCRVLERLGRGGMGTVYLAELVDDRPYGAAGTRVAVKHLHPDRAADDVALRRLAREAAIGGRLAHPGLVRVHEIGADGTGDQVQHFLVMELVEGTSLRELLRQVGTLPEPLVRTIAGHLAHALAALHAAGVVHRDVKPENVLLTPSHEVRLVDFGIARPLSGGTPITSSGWFQCTPRYASPEQVAGRRIDATSDLFSLGVVLHEAAAGRVPFDSDDPMELQRLHRERLPPPVSSHAAVSAFLDEVVAWLLAREPSRRPASAAELARILDEAERGPWWRARAPTGGPTRRRAGAPRPDEALPLLGRAREVEALGAAWREARAGAGLVVIVEGEAGVGKSRLADALARELEHEATILRGAHSPGGVPGGAGAMGRALRSLLGDGALEPAVADQLGEAARIAPLVASALEGLPPPAGLDPLPPEALRDAITRLARAVGASGPALWILDDVHEATPSERALLRELAASARHAPVLVLLLARDPVDAATASALEAAAPTRRLRLERLGDDDVERLVRRAFRSAATGERVARRLAARAAGNPYFALEMVRDLEARAAASAAGGGAPEPALAVPSTIRDLLLARLEGLDEGDRAIVEVAAVLGATFDPDPVAAVLGRRRLDVLQSLARLERLRRVVRAEADAFAFDSIHVREVVLDSLAPLLRREYHRLLAIEMERAHGAEPSGARAVALAEHALRGGDPARARPVLVAALDHLASAHLNETATELARLALRAGALDPALEADVAARLAERLELLGEWRAQHEAARRAVGAATTAGDAARRAVALSALARGAMAVTGPVEARAAMAEALAAAREAADGRLHARVLRHAGWVEELAGSLRIAAGHYREAAGLARASGVDREEAAALSRLGIATLALGVADEAAACLERALAIARRDGDAWTEAIALGSLGRARRHLGDYPSARGAFEEQRALARRIGYVQGESNACGNLGLVHLELGEREAALASFDAQASLAAMIGLESGERAARVHRGLVHLADGRLHEAVSVARAEAVAAQGLGQEAVAFALSRLARVEIALGDVASARSRTDEARALAPERSEAAEAYLLQADAECDRLDGRGPEAAAAHARALAVRRTSGSACEIAEAAWLCGRALADAGQEGEARALLLEAADVVSRTGVADPGPLPACLLAALGARPAGEVTIEPRVPPLLRVEAHALLARATGAPQHAIAARVVLEETASRLDEPARERFLLRSPSSRSLRDR